MEEKRHKTLMIMSLDKVVNLFLIIRLSRKKTRFCCMRVSSGDKVFKTFGPRSSMTKCQALSGSKLFNTLMKCLDVFFYKL